MRTVLMIIVLLSGSVATSLAPATAAPRIGRETASARPNINRPKPNRPQAGGMSGMAARGNADRNRNFGNRNPGNFQNRPNRPGNRPGGNSRRRGNNVMGNNVIIANGSPGRGYYDNGRYYDRRDDDGDDFLEFVGKTAAVTAGVSVVSAVIGSVVNDKPSDDCQQQVQNGQVYLLCDGVWYTPAQAGGQAGYEVVAPPAAAAQ